MQFFKIFSKVILVIMLPLAIFGQNNIQETKHSFFVAGPKFTGIIGEENQVIWDSGNPGARDGYVLKNGNVIICWADEVREYDSDKKIIFNYHRKEESMELGTAIRLRNGRTMITESGNHPRIIEVSKTGQVLKSVPLRPETENVHMQTRMARKLKNGNYLVPHLLAFAIKEYNPQGDVIRQFKTDTSSFGGKEAENWPFTAIRLKNGNTLVTLTHGNKVVEMDSKGNIVWKLTNENLKGTPLVDPCGAQRLPNGNTVIASYGAKDGIKLLEVDKAKNVIWNYEGYNAHHFQILTTNGKPVKRKPLK